MILTQSLRTGLLFLAISLTVYAASAQTDLVGSSGVHIGEELSVEIGLGITNWQKLRLDRHLHFEGHTSAVIGGSLEMILADDPVYGLRAGAWVNAVIALGVAFGYYTNFDQGVVVFQPEVGIGFAEGKVTWRPTIPFAEMPPGMSRSDISLSVSFLL